MQFPIAEKATVHRALRHLLIQHKRLVFATLGAQIAGTLAVILIPYVFGKVIDLIKAGTDLALINRLMVVLVGAVCAQAILRGIAHRLGAQLGENIFAHLREGFIATVTHLPLSAVERAGTGDLISRSTKDINDIQWMIRFGLPDILISTVTIIAVTLSAIILSPLLSLALLVALPLLIPSWLRYIRRSTPLYILAAQRFAEVNASIAQTAAGLDTVDALALGPARRRHNRRALQRVWDADVATMWLRIRLFIPAQFALLLPAVAAMGWGAYLYQYDLVTIGQIVAVAMYADQLKNPVDRLLNWVSFAQITAVSFARVLGVEEVPPDREPGSSRPAGRDLEVRGVGFSYTEGQPVLHDVDLTVRAGERIAIVGPSGAGKSTLGRLLAGIHPPASGSVRLGGVELVSLPEADLPRQVALVTQEHHVFVGSVADNLRLVKPDAADTEIERALATVGAADWVARLPEGVNTEVGSAGHTLSPAQAQQVALARLLLLDPQALVLDEATSLLDPRAARKLEQGLAQVLTGRTVIAIAHRLYTAHDADRVIVMDDGRIVEQGSHDELVAAGGAYAQLWASWQQQ